MLLEFTATQLEKVTTEMESMMNNRVNIDINLLNNPKIGLLSARKTSDSTFIVNIKRIKVFMEYLFIIF